ncbi:hypothetical protein R6Q59_011125 [Mikania micrantha]|uniref:Uncharacterized protein n=1 Tax=Mikania micrantha TaxID=192012 RepID=A0A5N6N4K1_9ASTR|nr:hypothetical protein E3N88_24894 [Mikania micrantha]
MESKVSGYCAIAFILGIIAAATGFAGEATRVKAQDVSIAFDTCIYPSSPALALGIVSAVFAIVTRIYISGCCRTDPNSTPVSKLLFVLSWVATVIAVVLLLSAAVLNNRQGGQVDSYGYITCYVAKPGIFAAGAVLALLSAIFGIAAFIIISSSSPQTVAYPAVALPMGTNVDPEKNQVVFPHQQYAPQRY